jgi:hypothetical protein
MNETEERWPPQAVQKAILKDFCTWFNGAGTVGLYAITVHGKRLTHDRFTDEQINNAIDRFILESGSGVKLGPI